MSAEHKHHILPLSLYLNIAMALIGLTVITVWVSFYNFGPFNLLVAMAVAAVKASLVALFFMHLKYDNKFYLLIFVSSILFLAIFIVLTMFDTMNRDDIDKMKAGPINPNAAMYDSLKVEQHPLDSLVSDSTAVVEDSTAH